MDSTGVGTAVMLGIAALLWFVYLVPTWRRRREYLATERTATRLGQTLRVLAETAEMPDQVRVAVTAREAAQQERLLRDRERPTLAPRDPVELRRRRMRRTRFGASILMIAATVVGVVQLGLIATTGFVPGAWLVLAVCAATGVAVIAVQRRLDAVAGSRFVPMPRDGQTRVVDIPVPADPAPWTPVPVPRPLYLTRPAPAPVRSAVDLEELRAAARASEDAVRVAQSDPSVPRLRPAVSPYARMGIVDPADAEGIDLDEVLRRRRTAG